MPVALKRNRNRRGHVVKAPRGLKRKFLDYKKILKNDLDCDYAHILILLKYKLERTRKCIVSNDLVTDARKIGRQIRDVVVLLDRVIKDEYYEEISDGLQKKYGRRISKRVPLNDGSGNLRWESRLQRETPQNRHAIRMEVRRLIKKADRMKVQDLKKAFDLMLKHIWRWWD